MMRQERTSANRSNRQTSGEQTPVPVQASFFGSADLGSVEAADVAKGPTQDKPANSKSVNHLAAAKRLSRQMRRLPKPRQTRAGLAICRHLIALLDEVE